MSKTRNADMFTLSDHAASDFERVFRGADPHFLARMRAAMTGHDPLDCLICRETIRSYDPIHLLVVGTTKKPLGSALICPTCAAEAQAGKDAFADTVIAVCRRAGILPRR